MTVEATRPAAPRTNWLVVRLAAAIIAGGGRLPNAAALALANSVAGRRPEQRLRDALGTLLADQLVVEVDEVWWAPDLGDLAAWLADAVEAREDAGLPVNPAIPHARSAA